LFLWLQPYKVVQDFFHPLYAQEFAEKTRLKEVNPQWASVGTGQITVLAPWHNFAI